MELRSSRHAVSRCGERGISQAAIDVLLRFGTCRLNGRGGAMAVLMTAAGRAQARMELGRDYVRLANQLDIVLILVDGVLVTAYRRCRRLKFHGARRAGRRFNTCSRRF